MAGLKSQGVAGVRRLGAVTSSALRKLFRRPLPAAHDTPSPSAAARAADLDSTSTHAEENRDQHRDGKDGGNGSEHTDADMTALPKGTRAQESDADQNKENQPLAKRPDKMDKVIASVGKLGLDDEDLGPFDKAKGSGLDEPAKEHDEEDMEIMELTPERAMHLKFIREALDMARLALRTNETPVGCVLVHNDKVIARGMNATNVTRNGTRHAEFMALSALLSYAPRGAQKTTCLKPKVDLPADGDSGSASVDSRQPDDGNEDGSKGHLYPYGQKCHPDERVDRSIIQESVLYVTVEPCVMCASLLRQLKIKKVYFGAVNDKFGGTGGVFSIHANSLPVRDDGQTASVHPMPKPVTLPDGNIMLGTSFPPGGGDGGNVEQGYEIEGGWGRDDAVGLLRRFYVQENGRAPVPRKKEGRAARLAAMMEKDADGSVAEAETAQSGDDDIPMAPTTMAENVRPGGDGETKSTAGKVHVEGEGDNVQVLAERPAQ